MISPIVIERPGRGQLLLLSLILLLVWLPVFWLASSVGANLRATELLSIPFLGALRRSIIQAGLVSACAFFVGFPLGLSFGLLRIPGGHVVAAVLAVPLLIPGFVWAIGWAMFRNFLA